jgi:hypothetical protein
MNIIFRAVVLEFVYYIAAMVIKYKNRVFILF